MRLTLYAAACTTLLLTAGCDDTFFGGDSDVSSTFDANPFDTGVFDAAGFDVGDGSCAPPLTGLNGWPSSVEVVTVAENDSTTVTGNIDSGQCTDLSFAESSSVACFPGTQFDKYAGSQRFYGLGTPIPARSILTVTMTPDPDVDLGLYGYRTQASTFVVPPAISSVGACEAGYTPNVPGPGAPETIEFQNPGEDTHNVFVAVAGPEGVTQGGYTLEFTLEVYVPHCPESLPGESYDSWPSSVDTVALSASGADQVATVSGNVSDGTCMNVEFAEDSSNACFPATQFEHFEGNQVFYALDQGLGPQQQVEIALRSSADLNLYAIQTASTSFQVPPMVRNVTSCEYGLHNDDTISFDNPTDRTFNIFFAVAGASDVTEGAFDVDITVSPRP